jgi:hypothetical protein
MSVCVCVKYKESNLVAGFGRWVAGWLVGSKLGLTTADVGAKFTIILTDLKQI